MAKVPSLRASDSDREHVAERLRYATGEGRLNAKELEERLDVLFAARTHDELDALLADLRESRSPWRQRVRVARWVGAAGGALALAQLGRLATRRRRSGPGAGRGPVEGTVVDPFPGVTVVASMVRLSLLERGGEICVNAETAAYHARPSARSGGLHRSARQPRVPARSHSLTTRKHS